MNPACPFSNHRHALQGFLHEHVTRHDGSTLPRVGDQVPFPGAGVIPLRPVEQWHVEHGSRWFGTNRANLFDIAWDRPYIAKVQLHYLGVKKYTPTEEDFEDKADWYWVSDLEDEPRLGESSSDTEISALSESSSEGEVVVAGGSEADRKKAERKAAKAKKEAKAAAKAVAASEAAARKSAWKAENARRKAEGHLYLSKRGTHWGKDPNGESEALALVKTAAALRQAKLDKAKRKAGRASANAKAKAAERAAKKRGEGAGMRLTLFRFLLRNEQTDLCASSRQRRGHSARSFLSSRANACPARPCPRPCHQEAPEAAPAAG